MCNRFLAFIMTVLLLGVAACSTSIPHLPPESKSLEQQGPRVLIKSYKMSVGDEIQINVWKNPEFSLAEPIRPDGKISIPLVGDVMAAGLTPEELAEKIESRLADYIKSPNVTIVLTSLRGHEFLSRIRVTGSVVQNMSMPYLQGMTVLDAVLEAGSVDLFADANNTKLHRKTEAGAESYDIYLKDIMERGDMTTNILLMPGDIITVPESSF